MSFNSCPAFSQVLKGPEKNNKKSMNTKVTQRLITKEDEAIEVFSALWLPTNFICAFFRRFDFVASNKLVTIKKKAQTPICGFVKLRIRITKFTSPKKVNENRCRKVKNAERIQYDDRYFFKGAQLLKGQTYKIVIWFI